MEKKEWQKRASGSQTQAKNTQKRAQRSQKGAKMEPMGAKREPKRSQRVRKGSQRVPKGSERATKMDPKFASSIISCDPKSVQKGQKVIILDDPKSERYVQLIGIPIKVININLVITSCMF